LIGIVNGDLSFCSLTCQKLWRLVVLTLYNDSWCLVKIFPKEYLYTFAAQLNDMIYIYEKFKMIFKHETYSLLK